MPRRGLLIGWIGAALVAASMCLLCLVLYRSYLAYRLVGALGDGPTTVEFQSGFLWISLLIFGPLVVGLLLIRSALQRK